MNRAAKSLVGTHDFKSFCSIYSQAATTVRTITGAEVLERPVNGGSSGERRDSRCSWGIGRRSARYCGDAGDRRDVGWCRYVSCCRDIGCRGIGGCAGDHHPDLRTRLPL